MKAVTIYEPWATLIVLGYKQFETRSWSTNWRGELAIHAAVTRKYCGEREVTEILERALVPSHQWGRIVKAQRPGYVLGMARLVEVFPTERLAVSPQERALGNFEMGRFGWKLTHVAPLLRPIHVRGRQQIWNLPSIVEDEIRAQFGGAA